MRRMWAVLDSNYPFIGQSRGDRHSPCLWQRHVFLRSFGSITPLLSNCTIFRHASGEQRGCAFEISHEHVSCHKHGLISHSWVGLRPILSYRCRGVIYLTNQVNLVSSMEQDRRWMYEGWKKRGALSSEWIAKTNVFLDHAFARSETGTDVRCPCSKC
jgi:hypothetical protein